MQIEIWIKWIDPNRGGGFILGIDREQHDFYGAMEYVDEYGYSLMPLNKSFFTDTNILWDEHYVGSINYIKNIKMSIPWLKPKENIITSV